MNPGRPKPAITRKAFFEIASRLLHHPAAPYHELAVGNEVSRICTEHGLVCERDRYGNLLVRLSTAVNRRPLVLAAHLDHPGFEIIRPLSPQCWLARFRGGVPDLFFKPGLKVRLMPGSVPARLDRCADRAKRLYRICSSQTPAEPPSFSVWDLEPGALRDGRIVARACDDLIGSAAVLAALIELKRSKARVHVIGVLTRAEEVGFHGALALAARRGIPKSSLVISLETSKELPGVTMGRGVIVRVGDRASVFDSAATRFLTEVATELEVTRKDFCFQRALMGGGTCEATAYQEFGYQSAAVCVALGNYHNCGRNGRIEAEFVSIDDALSMVELLVSAANRLPEFEVLAGKLPRRLQRLLREARVGLARTPGSPAR